MYPKKPPSLVCAGSGKDGVRIWEDRPHKLLGGGPGPGPSTLGPLTLGRRIFMQRQPCPTRSPGSVETNRPRGPVMLFPRRILFNEKK